MLIAQGGSIGSWRVLLEGDEKISIWDKKDNPYVAIQIDGYNERDSLSLVLTRGQWEQILRDNRD